MNALAALAGLVSFGCAVMVLIKLFQAEGVGKGILGIICGIYAFVWGWQNNEKNNQKNIMIVWSIAAALGIIFNIAAASKSSGAVKRLP
jgi:hypothetical protein